MAFDARAVTAELSAPGGEVHPTLHRGELRFEHKRDDRHAGLHLTTRFFRADRDLTLAVPGEPTLPRGERVFLNFRYAYTPESFRWLLAKHAGLKVLEEVRSADGLSIVAICSR